MAILRLGVGVGMRRLNSGLVVPDPFVPEQLISSNTDFADSTGWTTATGITISGGVCTFNHTASTSLLRTAANLTRTPAAGEKLFLEFDVVSYTDGNIGPRIRFTDASVMWFFGDQNTGAAQLAGGDAAPGHKVSPVLILPEGKIFDRLEMRTTLRNSTNNWVCDNLEMWTSE